MPRIRLFRLYPLVLFIFTALTSSSVHAHFVWLKTAQSGSTSKAVLSFGEAPSEEDYHLPDSLLDMEISWRGKAGKLHPLTTEHIDTDDRVVLEAGLPSGDARVLEGTCTYGVYASSMLNYYAKHVHCLVAEELGEFGPSEALKLDLVPKYADDELQITVLWESKPLPEAKLSLTDAKGEEQTATSDSEGVAKFSIPSAGLVAVLCGKSEDGVKGEVDGKKYTGISNYITLTFPSFGGTEGEHGASSASNTPKPVPTSGIPRLPEPIASFGAATTGDWLYVYSGHTGGAHEHSVENLSTHFCRVRLNDKSAWEELPMQQSLQGFPLVAYNNSLYRVGGMYAKNKPEEDDELYGVADFARFDVASNSWIELPSLPEARSSHDAVVIGDSLYVTGGWTLDGEGDGEWLSKSLVYNLSNDIGAWQELPQQPFERRALAASHWQGKLVVAGGIDSFGSVSQEFDLYDPETQTWSKGPELPGERMGGFGVSAWNHQGQLYVSGLDGIVYQLSNDGTEWSNVGELETARFFHRLLPAGSDRLLVVGGASFESGHLDDVEFVQLEAE